MSIYTENTNRLEILQIILNKGHTLKCKSHIEIQWHSILNNLVPEKVCRYIPQCTVRYQGHDPATIHGFSNLQTRPDVGTRR